MSHYFDSLVAQFTAPNNKKNMLNLKNIAKFPGLLDEVTIA